MVFIVIYKSFNNAFQLIMEFLMKTLLTCSMRLNRKIYLHEIFTSLTQHLQNLIKLISKTNAYFLFSMQLDKLFIIFNQKHSNQITHKIRTIIFLANKKNLSNP